jgi:hypothetical protein
MELGGPVWHASAAPTSIRLGPQLLERFARDALEGVGDAGLGEWVEQGDIAVHVRRRLTEREELLVGPVIDIRGTSEATERLRSVSHLLPAGWSE